MQNTVDLSTLQFGDPLLLWLLVVPALLLLLWGWQVVSRRRDARRLLVTRQVPRRERFPVFGSTLFWLFLTGALVFLIAALAQPKVVASFVRTGGADIVVLLDGSASMHVK